MGKQIVWDSQDLGVTNSSYDSPPSTMFSQWDHVFVGQAINGERTNAYYAFEDAVHIAAWSGMFDGVNWESIVNPFNETEDADALTHEWDCPLSNHFHMTEEQEADEDFDPETCLCSDGCELYYSAALFIRVVESPFDGGSYGGGDRLDCGDGMTRYITSVDYEPRTKLWVIEDWAENKYVTHTFRIEDNTVIWEAMKIRDWSER